jgi:hypothetical protein
MAGIQDQLTDGGTIGRRLAEQRGGLFNVRAKIVPIKSAIHWAQARYKSSFEPK